MFRFPSHERSAGATIGLALRHSHPHWLIGSLAHGLVDTVDGHAYLHSLPMAFEEVLGLIVFLCLVRR